LTVPETMRRSVESLSSLPKREWSIDQFIGQLQIWFFWYSRISLDLPEMGWGPSARIWKATVGSQEEVMSMDDVRNAINIILRHFYNKSKSDKYTNILHKGVVVVRWQGLPRQELEANLRSLRIYLNDLQSKERYTPNWFWSLYYAWLLSHQLGIQLDLDKDAYQIPPLPVTQQMQPSMPVIPGSYTTSSQRFNQLNPLPQYPVPQSSMPVMFAASGQVLPQQNAQVKPVTAFFHHPV
jgi:hypothetical protein